MLGRILIVDDSPVDRTIIKSMLSDRDTLAACDGVEAMQMLEEHSDINIMILDLNMPNMNGFQVLQEIKTDTRFSRLRTIILTNHDELDNEIRGLQLGAVDFIRKPIHMDSLRARIDVHTRLLQRQYDMEKRFEDQSTTLKAILAKIPLGVAISFAQGPVSAESNEYFSVNQAFEQLTGRTKDELLEMGWAAITHPDDLEEEQKQYQRLLSGEIENYALDKRIIKPDGAVVWVNLLLASIKLAEGHHFNHIALARDIGEKRAIEEKLTESERSKSVFLSHLPGMAYRCKYDRNWTMLFVSSGCLGLTGYTPESLLDDKDLSFNDLITPQYRELLWKQWNKVLAEKKPLREEYEITTADGSRKWVFEIGQGVYNDQGEVEALEGIIIDISDRKAMEDQIRHYNEHDAWTGLPNRRYLEAVLTEDSALDRTENAALISVNLNAMHTLSLTYGFQYGQDLIKRIADELRSSFADQCSIFNTSEYRFILHKKGYKDSSELLAFCHRVTDTLNPFLSVDRITVGLGVLEVNSKNKGNVELLLKQLLITSEEAVLDENADNHICIYNKEFEERVLRREIIQQDLTRIAVGEGEDRLFLQYQPILDLRENRICGFEALARHQSCKLGLVPPLEFIPIIEKTKHIIPIGKIIAEKACSFARKLSSVGQEALTVSINVSVIQLLSKGFVEQFLETIATMQVNPEQISIELTESAFSSDFAEINRILGQFRDLGIKSSIDDFGTGYSSLSRERELNVDCLKIDKPFIDKLLWLRPEETIASDIISIAHKLGHCVVAEGVEREEQLEYLRTHRCDKVQGYLISKPLDEEQALAFVDRYNSKQSKDLCEEMASGAKC